MRYKFSLAGIIFSALLGTWIQAQEQQPIPNHLLSCYSMRPKVLPQTMETLIEIIRKIEMAPTYSSDMKIFSIALLHKFRIDGIEKDPNVVLNSPGVTPYRVTGFQSYRQKTLFQYLIPNNNVFFPINILSEVEKCNLHWMLSSTVDIWERGDERKVCPLSIQGYASGPIQRFGAKMSSCPEEWGVVYQEHGTVSPGTVIAGIAAGLAPLQVQQTLMLTYAEQLQQSKTPGWQQSFGDSIINNTYAATLAGDLAEVIQFQESLDVKDISLGPAGVWNDTFIPTASYFTNLDSNHIDRKTWQITDAEILGGVDGLLLSYRVPSWVNQIKTLRLSQVLEMYYTDKGVMSDSNLRACNREMNIGNLIASEKQLLLSQVENFAGVLSSKVPRYSNTEKSIHPKSSQTLDIFMAYLNNLMKKSRCVSRIEHLEKINLTVIIDQTWPSYTTLQLMLFLSRAIDVSYYGSSMTVINGQTGSLIVNAAQNTTDVFLSWNSSSTEPMELNLPQSLLTVKTTTENLIEYRKTQRRFHSHSHIVLVMGYSSTITNVDHDKAKGLVSAVKALDPDMKFVYVSSRINVPRFVQLTALPGSHNDKIVSIENINNIQSFITQLEDPISLVPRSLIPPYCQANNKYSPESEYEEYITPGQPLKYRIHPDYLCGSSSLQIKIINWDYGNINVCMSREAQSGGSPLCKIIKTNEQYNFSISKPCVKPKKQIQQANSKQMWLETCKPVFLDVTAEMSLNRCLENGCRYPDQVKFNIILQGLKCVEPYKTICSSCYVFTPNMYIIVTILILSFINNLWL